MKPATWIVVLVKDFDSAKQRLSPAMGARSRRALARNNARLAVGAAAGADHVLVVTGSEAGDCPTSLVAFTVYV